MYLRRQCYHAPLILHYCQTTLNLDNGLTPIHAGLTWPLWLVAVSLLFAPLWFSPLSFTFDKLRADWRGWRAWLKGQVDCNVQCSWHAWNRWGWVDAGTDKQIFL